MKAIRLGVVVLACICLPGLNPAGAQKPDFEIEADAALLMEVNSGEMIWEANSFDRLYPASLTKIMSLLLALEQLEQGKVSLDDQVYISARASAMGGSQLFLSEGDVVSLENLLIGMAVASGNDAAVAVAEHLGGSVEGFAGMMNEKVRELGMAGSNFCNPHGLHDPEHYTTAHDVMLMSVAIMEYPLIHRWATIWMDEHFLQDQIKSGEVFLSNTNRMVSYYHGCDGLKTGFTAEAGNGISATARRGQTRFLAVVLGAPTVDDRYEAARMLLDYGFGHFTSIVVAEKGAVVASVPVDKGSPPGVDVVTEKKLGLLLPREAGEDYRQEISLPLLRAPLEEDQKVGEMVVTYGDNEKAAVNLIVAEPVSRASQPLIFLRLLNRWLRFGR